MNNQPSKPSNAGTFDRLRRNQTCLRLAKTAIAAVTFATFAACSNGQPTSNGFPLFDPTDLPAAEVGHRGRQVAVGPNGEPIRSNAFVPWTMFGDPNGGWHIELAGRTFVDSATAWVETSTGGEVIIQAGRVATPTEALSVYRYSGPVLPTSASVFSEFSSNVATIEGEAGSSDVALIRNPSNVILIVGHSPSAPFDGAHLIGPDGEVLSVITGVPVYPDQADRQADS